MSRRLRLACWSLILAVALGLRLPTVWAGLPYLNYVDEGHVLHRVVRMLRERRWDPLWYLYPALPLVAVRAAATAEAPVYKAVHGHRLRDDLSVFPPKYYDLVEPADLIVLGRLLTLAAGLATVVLTGRLARWLGGPSAELVAAWTAALVPALVIRSALVTVDPYAAFFCLAAVFFGERSLRGGTPRRDALLAGAMTGLALTSKYPGILAAIPVTISLLRGEGGWTGRIRRLELAALGGLVAVFAVMPALFLKPHRVFTDVGRQFVLYARLEMVPLWDQIVRRAEWDQPLDHPELGLAFLALVAAGWLSAVADRRTRPSALGWAVWGIALVLILLRYTFQPFRNLLPLVPLACVLVGLLAAKIRERVPRPAWVDAAASLLIAGLFLPADLAYARNRATLVDSRVQAVDWLREHAGPGDAVLVSEELAIVRSEVGRLGPRATVLPVERARPRLRRHGGYRFLVTGEFERRGGMSLNELVARGRARDRYRLAARFGERPGTGMWRGNRQIVYVYEAATPSSASTNSPVPRPSPGGRNANSTRPEPFGITTPSQAVLTVSVRRRSPPARAVQPAGKESEVARSFSPSGGSSATIPPGSQETIRTASGSHGRRG